MTDLRGNIHKAVVNGECPTCSNNIHTKLGGGHDIAYVDGKIGIEYTAYCFECNWGEHGYKFLEDEYSLHSGQIFKIDIEGIPIHIELEIASGLGRH